VFIDGLVSSYIDTTQRDGPYQICTVRCIIMISFSLLFSNYLT